MSESITTAAELMGFLADARAEYDHGDGDDYLSGQINAARTLAAILAGKNDAAGWLPSWRWDEFAALIATYRPDADLSPVKPSREDVARMVCSYSGPLGTHYFDHALRAADAILALLPGRSVAAIKAEALREHAHRVTRFMPPGLVNRATVIADLAEYADRLESETDHG